MYTNQLGFVVMIGVKSDAMPLPYDVHGFGNPICVVIC